ncbi:MAG: 3-dehydroquinate synthase [Magnetococcus sp. DMHC-6]
MKTSRSFRLDLGPRSYDIDIGGGLLEGVGQRLQPLLPGAQVAIVSNTTVAPLYLPTVTASLEAQGLVTLPIILADGELYKNWISLNKIFDALIAARCERSTTLLALGGGVVGDMTGFAAAAYLRGIAFAQLPTTLLSQVDASVGGKTGINHPLGKNLIGAFYQPKWVGMDLNTLKTLPKREFLAGVAEVIKYGMLGDAVLFQLLEQRLEDFLALDTDLTSDIIYTCCAIKAAVVAQDEREAGKRALLNLGHTFAHAIESLAGYDGRFLHGEAVAIGLLMAADLSWRMDLCSKESLQRVRQLLLRAALPIQAPRFSIQEYLEALSHDKKVQEGQIRFVLLRDIGHASVEKEIPKRLLEQTLEENMV